MLNNSTVPLNIDGNAYQSFIAEEKFRQRINGFNDNSHINMNTNEDEPPSLSSTINNL